MPRGSRVIRTHGQKLRKRWSKWTTLLIRWCFLMQRISKLINFILLSTRMFKRHRFFNLKNKNWEFFNNWKNFSPIIWLTNWTTPLFWSGVTLQQTTASHFDAISMKLFLAPSSAHSKFLPSIKMTLLWTRSTGFLGMKKSTKNFLTFPMQVWVFSKDSSVFIGEAFSCEIFSRRLFGWSSDRIIKSSPFFIRLQLREISSAVWSLSPVKTQTAKPASRKL